MIRRMSPMVIVLLAGVSLSAQVSDQREPEVLPTGKFATASCDYEKATAKAAILCDAAVSQDGKYRCTYTTAPGQAERFSIKEFSFFHGSSLLFRKNEMPGNSISISNAGFCALFDLGDDSPGLTVNLFGRDGEPLFSKTVENSTLSGFSSAGTRFGIAYNGRFEIIDPAAKMSRTYSFTPWQFDVSADGRLLALAGENKVAVYEGEKCVASIPHDLFYVRKVQFSSDNKFVGFIGKNELFVYSLPHGKLLFSDRIEEPLSFNDLLLGSRGPLAGIHCRDRSKNESRGILRRYDFSGTKIGEKVESVKKYPPAENLVCLRKSNSGAALFPWPFKPQNKPCKPWNSYLQLSSASDGDNAGAYLHQGLDMDVPSYAQTCAVAGGYVKAVLTIGGDIYWRVAISEVQTADSSDGWLHAHLLPSSIAVNVGDQVQTGDVLGEIIPWPGLPGGHIHFSRIRSRGTTWSSWRNICNPLMMLTPSDDTTAPEFQNAFSYSKFGFSTNDTAAVRYLKPDSLSGAVDFLVKVRDICGASPWTQAANSIHYWVKSLRTNAIVFPRTLGYMRNQGMPDYSGALYNSLAPIIYRIDNTFPVKGWFTKERLYVHVITNNNGDSAITESENRLAFNTKAYPDGTYRLVVEVCDAANNCSTDSQDVVFRNGNIVRASQDAIAGQVTGFGIVRSVVDGQGILLTFQLPASASARVQAVDITGRVVRTLLTGNLERGRYSIRWDGMSGNGRRVSPGTYIVTLQAGAQVSSVKVQRL